MQDMIIAIDGFSSTGKSTLAKLLARKLGYVHIDSGAMYRAITLYAMQNQMFQNGEVDVERLLPALDTIEIHFERNPDTGKNEIYLNGNDIENEIRSMEISENVSRLAKIQGVRDFAVSLQRKMGKKKGIVMDGRDIGTVVFPHADLKIFLNASAEERAKRRYLELIKQGEKVTLQEVIENINERDRLDTTREIAPLRQAEDAILVDNGELTVEQTLERVMEIIRSRELN
ncbi:MAG: (d)CMP kinase [Weeksellaceae bacterium]